MLRKCILNKRVLVIILIALIQGRSLFSQDLLNDTIVIWSKDYKLKPQDFQKDKIDENVKIGGICTSSLEVEYNTELSVYNVKSLFYKRSSYIVRDVRRIDLLLEHEQIHFDITELFARKFRKWLFEIYQSEQGINENLLFNKYDTFLEQQLKYQLEYDKDVNHSINQERQKEWLKKISKELNELEPYSHENYLKTIENL